MAIAVVTAVALVTGSTVTTVLAQQAGNMTAGGGDLIKKLMSSSVKAKSLQAVINNKDVFVVVCDPDTKDPSTNCKIFTI